MTAAAARHDAVATLLADAAQQLEQRDLDAASATIERALRIDPNDASLWRLLAEVRHRQGLTAQSNALLAKAAAIDANPGSHTNRQPLPDVAAASVEEPGDAVPRIDNAATRAGQRDRAWVRSQTALAEAIAKYRAAEDSDEAALGVVSEQQQWMATLAERLRKAQLRRERLISALRDRVPIRRSEHRHQGAVDPGNAHRRQSALRYRIPSGHLPPPGMCRAWFPDRPPGHQPPPEPCRDLSHRLPVGAVLVGYN